MWKWFPPDPKDPSSKYVKVIKITGNRLEISIDPGWIHKEPKPGRPIPPEDRR